MIAMTYGTLPARELFNEQFAKVCPDGTFTISNSSILEHFGGERNVTFTCDSLWYWLEDMCENAHVTYTEAESELLLSLGSSAMTFLGFEWI